MNKLWVVAKNELMRYFASPLAYVYLLAFLLLNGSFALYFGHFFERGNADLSPMFAFQPWLYLLFISGISMRLWAEEFRSKTIVQLVTMPVSVAQLVWGKFLASWLFCALALGLTFPFWITVNWLGNPDNTVIAVGYGASLVLAGCMLAISQTMSALTKNQVIALVLAVVANLLFFWSGLEYVLAFFRLFAPLSVIDMIASFSFLTHFDAMSAGVLELRDAVFFVSLILLFNFTTMLVVSFKTSGTSELLQSGRRAYYAMVFGLMLLGFVGLNLMANNYMRSVRYDFSEEKMFTLSKNTIEMLRNLEYPVVAKVYYSKVLEQRNPVFRQMFDKVRILLAQMSDEAEGKFSYRIYYPEVLSKREDLALAAGMQPLPLVDNNMGAFFGVEFVDEVDNRQVIPFLMPERSNYLEQDVAEKIFALREKKKTVGIWSSLSMFDTMQTDTMVSQKWEIVNKISEQFKVVKVEKPEEIEKLDVLMIVQPEGWDEEMIAAVKNYTIKGGKVLLFADVAAEAPRLYSVVNNDLNAAELYGLDEFWGFRFDRDVVVADLDNSLLVDVSASDSQNPLFTQDVLQFVLGNESLNRTMAETQNLRGVLLASASVITPIKSVKNRVFLPLIRAGYVSELMPAEAAQRSINPAVLLQAFKPEKAEKTIAAKIVSLDEKMPFTIIAVADTDLLYDDFWARKNVVAGKEYVEPLTDNANFVLNALESLAGGENLLGLRGKSTIRRPFEKVENMRRQNAHDFRVKEAEIFKQIEQVKLDLQDVWNKKSFEGRENFTPDELAVVAGIRKNLERLKGELASIKANLNSNVKMMDLKVKFLNIYLVPLAIAWGLLLWVMMRPRREEAVEKIKLNRKVAGLAVGAVLLLAGGAASTYLAGTNTDEMLEGKAVFADLAENINDVDRIVIENHDAKIKLYKQEGVWMLDNPAGLPVYQERVRSFLSALLEARYFEKKTADAAYLRKFDLNPIEEEGSKNTRIVLEKSDGRTVAAFEVGKYDLEAGRGSRAAYIKFDNQFQVWLVMVDLVDISPDWRNWTYDTAWNLRFGRMSDFEISGADIQPFKADGDDRIAEMMKVLLNTYLKREISVPEKPEDIFGLMIKGEGGDKVKMAFGKDKNGFWLRYNFLKIDENKHLQIFEEYARGHFYEVAKEDVEGIINVIKRRKY